MNRNKWRGTVLFVIILTVMGLTIGLRLYGVGTVASTTSTVVASAPPSSAPPAPSPAPSTTTGSTPSPTATAAPAAPAARQKTVDGAVEQTPYGPVQVRITATGKTIKAVTVLQSPNDRQRSADISSQATPILAQEVLKSQSANIDTVSGATYTSDGYRQSVQSAIDKL